MPQQGWLASDAKPDFEVHERPPRQDYKAGYPGHGRPSAGYMHFPARRFPQQVEALDRIRTDDGLETRRCFNEINELRHKAHL